MTKALSVNLRERVVAVIDGGLSRRQAAARFGVSVSSAIRWHALARRTGTATPRQQGGDRRSGRIEAHADVILGAVAKQPDITLARVGRAVSRVRGQRRHRDAVAVLRAPEDHAQKVRACRGAGSSRRHEPS
ncbi:MAG: hypothetical protein ACRYFY_12280 [Janthinobacterium lividum]